VVLVSTGSYNPVHFLHVEKMILAKQFVEEKGWQFLCALLCPSSDDYIQGKLGNGYIPPLPLSSLSPYLLVLLVHSLLKKG
jgi:hypothetical protein